MSDQDFKTNDRVVVTGITGSGKTVWVHWLIDQLLPHRPIAVYDYKRDEYTKGYISQTPEIFGELPRGLFIYKPNPPSVQAAERLCRVALEKRNCIIVIEEADLYAQRHPSRVPPNLYQLIHSGRSMGIGSICITRRPQALHPDVLSQTQHVIAFKQHFPRDVEYLAKWIGKKVYRLCDEKCKEEGLKPLPITTMFTIKRGAARLRSENQ